MPPDIVRVIAAWSPGDRERLTRSLAPLLALPDGPRVVRCVLHLGNGDVDRVAHYVAAALGDPRDVIWWAEYDGGDVRRRDFSQPLG